MARNISLGLGIAGLFLGGTTGFLISRAMTGGDSATAVLAKALARESMISPTAWPLAISAASSILSAVLLPLTVVWALSIADRRRMNGRIEKGGNERRQRCKASRGRNRHIRGADSSPALGGVGGSTNDSDRDRVRLLASRDQGRD